MEGHILNAYSVFQTVFTKFKFSRKITEHMCWKCFICRHFQPCSIWVV